MKKQAAPGKNKMKSAAERLELKINIYIQSLIFKPPP
jgi:hypothetical protein